MVDRALYLTRNQTADDERRELTESWTSWRPAKPQLAAVLRAPRRDLAHTLR
jgi:hypothetical protein